MNDVLVMIPVLRRDVYLRRLFDWLRESLKASRASVSAPSNCRPDPFEMRTVRAWRKAGLLSLTAKRLASSAKREG